MSKVTLAERVVSTEQMQAALTGDNIEAVTLQSLQDLSQQIAAVHHKQQQQIKEDIKFIINEVSDGDQDATGDDTTVSDLEASFKARVVSLQSQIAENQTECQRVREQLTSLKEEQQKLREQRCTQKESKADALLKARCDANLYINITNIRWQYNSEPHEVKGYVKNKNVKTFDLNSQEVSSFYITNYMWGELIEEDW